MNKKIILEEEDIGRIKDYIDSGVGAINDPGGIGDIEDILRNLVDQSEPNKNGAFTITDVQIAALQGLLSIEGAEYDVLIGEALGPGRIANGVPIMESLSYREAIKIIQYGNDKFRKKKTKTDAQMLELQNFIIEALQDLIKAQVVKYNDLVEAAVPKVVVKKPLYMDAKTIIDHGSDTLKAKFKEHINKASSIEDILMDDNVSKEQIIVVMYDALDTMQRYNGNTVTYCLIGAIKDSDIVYEE